MDATAASLIKHREIGFRDLHPDPDQARSASLVLVDIPGVRALHVVTPLLLQLSYHVLEVSLEQLEAILDEAGFHLDNRLMYRLKRALYYYTEEAQQDALGCGRGRGNCTQAVFINRYRQIEHGCRDVRPDHWRRYL